MNKQLLFIAIALLNIYAGAQAAANNPKERAIAALRAEYKPFEALSVAELNDEYEKVQALLDNKATSWECEALHARNCEISEIFLRNYADETKKANLAAEMQRNLERMSNPQSSQERFALCEEKARITTRLFELTRRKAKIATESEEVI